MDAKMSESRKRKASQPKKKAKSCQENLRLWKCAFKDNLKLQFNKEDVTESEFRIKQKKKSRYSFDDHIQMTSLLNEKSESLPIGTVIHEIKPEIHEGTDSETEDFISVKERILEYEQASSRNLVKEEPGKDLVKSYSGERQSLFEVLSNIKVEKVDVNEGSVQVKNGKDHVVDVKSIQERVKNRSDIIMPLAEKSIRQDQLENGLMLEEAVFCSHVNTDNDSTETIGYEESDLSYTEGNGPQLEQSGIVLDLSKTGAKTTVVSGTADAEEIKASEDITEMVEKKTCSTISDSNLCDPQYIKQEVLEDIMTVGGKKPIKNSGPTDTKVDEFKVENKLDTPTRKRKCVEEDEEDDDLQRLNKMKKTPYIGSIQDVNGQVKRETVKDITNSKDSQDEKKPTEIYTYIPESMKTPNFTASSQSQTSSYGGDEIKENMHKKKPSGIPYLQNRPLGSTGPAGKHHLPCANVESLVKMKSAENSSQNSQIVEGFKRDNSRKSFCSANVNRKKTFSGDWRNAEIGTARLINSGTVGHQFTSGYVKKCLNKAIPEQQINKPSENQTRKDIKRKPHKPLERANSNPKVNACPPMDTRARDFCQQSGTSATIMPAQSYQVTPPSVSFHNPSLSQQHQQPTAIQPQTGLYDHSRGSHAYVQPNQREPHAQHHQVNLQNKHFNWNWYHHTAQSNISQRAHQTPAQAHQAPVHSREHHAPSYGRGSMPHHHMVPAATTRSQGPSQEASTNHSNMNISQSEGEALLASYRAMNGSSTDIGQGSLGNTPISSMSIEQLKVELQQERDRRMAAEHELYLLKMNLRYFVQHETPYQMQPGVKPNF